MKRPVWVLNRSALAAHGRLVAEYGGAPGANLAQLCLVLGWPKTILAFAQGGVSVFDLAVGYAEAVLRLRPFASSNERMAYVLAMLFLTLNGVRLPATNEEHFAMFNAFLVGVLDRHRYAQWMLMRAVAQGCGAVIGVRRKAQGKIVGVGELTSGRQADVTRRVAARAAMVGYEVPWLSG